MSDDQRAVSGPEVPVESVGAWQVVGFTLALLFQVVAGFAGWLISIGLVMGITSCRWEPELTICSLAVQRLVLWLPLGVAVAGVIVSGIVGARQMSRHRSPWFAVAVTWIAFLATEVAVFSLASVSG
nr:hypothetical protein [Kibdelosporangium sp. MJ126-NF4]